MKKRSIIEMVCSLRKSRDYWRKAERDGIHQCSYMDSKAERCYEEKNYEGQREWVNKRVGAYSVVRNYAGMADAFHMSAHRCMELLGR